MNVDKNLSLIVHEGARETCRDKELFLNSSMFLFANVEFVR